ncbi:MAG: hypothetical protein LBQ60_10005 [Bacteroidales bacterium]|jgi:asparagine synthase (glutamine-hydrolysing)|nr:hypothetical protein [Bacteroidales bacterium]
MSHIFGYISLKNQPLRDGLSDDMMQSLSSWSPDKSSVHINPDGFLGCLLMHTTKESLSEILPYQDQESKLIITADARIDNRPELSPILDLKNDASNADSIYILKAYQKWGSDCCRYLSGDYAFAIWNCAERELFCARDHIGARGFFYYFNTGKFIFATEPKGIIASGDIPHVLSDDWIADILIGVTPEKNASPFAQVMKLPPAHYLKVTPDKLTLEQYWELDISREIHYKREQDYYDELRALFEESISSCVRSAFPVGAELSGGLDSSGIAAFANQALRQQNKSLSTYSHVLPEWAKGKTYPFDDERIFIESLGLYANIDQQHFITAEDKGILDEFQLCNQRFDYPTGYPFPVFCDALYEKAHQEGVRVLLSGFPGDELVTSLGGRLENDFLRHHQYRYLWSLIYGKVHRDIFKTGYAFTLKMISHYAPGFYRMIKGVPGKSVNWRENSFNCHVATNEYADRMHLRDRLFNRTTYPVSWGVRELERARITEAFVCHRLEQCAAHAAYYHIEYRNPLADKRLLEYVLALPIHLRVKNGYHRYPFRMAIAGVVPEDIRWRTSKMGNTIPTVSLRVARDSDRIDHLLGNAGKDGLFPSYIDVEKMKYINQRMNHRQLGDALYAHSFYSALMMKRG